ncbi:hypothetical protein [Salinisphaera sp. T31B1]|uniref:hypothetical protein n=1 Tax=Salinisphaera sp. T31B1 TaxID=727963 RepID=UPI0033402B9E
MLVLAFWVLLAAAGGGAAMAGLDGATRPLRIGHGLIAGLGLFCLLIGALIEPGTLVWTAFGLLALGFAAGATLFGVIWRNSAPPRMLIWAHGAVNTLGVILLGVVVFG